MGCPESLNGKHESEEAEVESITPTETTVVFFCSQCGAEGKLIIKNSKINWDEDGLEEDDDDDNDWDDDEEPYEEED